MITFLGRARLELRRALEEHPGANELDQVTRCILEAVRAITAARREAMALHPGGDDRRGGGVRFVEQQVDQHLHDAARDGDRPPDQLELKVVRSEMTGGMKDRTTTGRRPEIVR